MVIVNIPKLQGLLVFILSKVAGIFGARTVSPTLQLLILMILAFIYIYICHLLFNSFGF